MLQNKANDYLPLLTLFGDKGYAVINDLARLPMLLPRLYLNLTGAC